MSFRIPITHVNMTVLICFLGSPIPLIYFPVMFHLFPNSLPPSGGSAKEWRTVWKADGRRQKFTPKLIMRDCAPLSKCRTSTLSKFQTFVSSDGLSRYVKKVCPKTKNETSILRVNLLNRWSEKSKEKYVTQSHIKQWQKIPVYVCVSRNCLWTFMYIWDCVSIEEKVKLCCFSFLWFL